MALIGCEQAKKRPITHNTLHTISHYAFFNGNLKWPPTQYQLTYGLPPGTPSNAISAVARAFSTWASQTPFTFSHNQDFASADLQIGFYSGEHGTGHHSTGKTGSWPMPFPPLMVSLTTTGTRLRVRIIWRLWPCMNPVAGSYHLETMALHEIGHLLGLGHSNVQDAIMFPRIPPATIKGLGDDDIRGIKTLYA
ncbi:hypothetical protein RHSIM_Rhsim08G0059400 [Rhododendron simsii]|uniref:Peptidase metallopeptidase domain-containing protein n=1 Tax=Rhododendron simsii TaxID=118357 RepID=A0A834GL55_RHOSS|nr:hypothetical protein RHSIM_Rhsim08G0059400 [Rhododendron simsii]